MNLSASNDEIYRLGGNKPYKRFTPELFDNKELLKECAVYPNKNLFIYGPAGTGKTHLGTAIIRKHRALIYKPQEIYRACRGLKTNEDEQCAINFFVRYTWLMIDDLGVSKDTAFSFSILYEILDGRDMWEQAGLIITSNLSLDQLADKLGDDRITSRIAGMCTIIKTGGIDRRINE